MTLTLTGKIVRSIELATGVSAQDKKTTAIVITQSAPGMQRVFRLVGIDGNNTEVSLSWGIMRPDQATKLANSLRDDLLRRGFRLTADRGEALARMICAGPPKDDARLMVSELSADSQAAIGRLTLL